MMLIVGYIILLRKNIIFMSRIRNKIWDAGCVKWYSIIDKVAFWDGIMR